MVKKGKPRLGISIGDPAGIGPEITVKALSHAGLHEQAVPVVYADSCVLEDALTGSDFTLNRIEDPRNAKEDAGVINYIDPGILRPGDYRPGEIAAAAGEASFQYVVMAIRDAMAKNIDAVVTGPISKEAVNMAGHHYAGHTEIFAEYTGTKNYGMLLSGGGLTVIHVTTHVALREACGLLSKERILNTIHLAGRALALMGKEGRRIAVAGLNPHASENGLFGTEEAEAIIPAVEAARMEGLDVTGPLPPDTVFVKALGGAFDVVVAMYHDQGHIPLKLAGFKMDPLTGRFTRMSGINTTIGLPIIRSSVDHGTAFDIAGKNIADEGSMIDAVNMAITFSENW
jgi:4-hydroxythreonine-4-phosphate dehydrogenase